MASMDKKIRNRLGWCIDSLAQLRTACRTEAERQLVDAALAEQRQALESHHARATPAAAAAPAVRAPRSQAVAVGRREHLPRQTFAAQAAAGDGDDFQLPPEDPAEFLAWAEAGRLGDYRQKAIAALKAIDPQLWDVMDAGERMAAMNAKCLELERADDAAEDAAATGQGAAI